MAKKNKLFAVTLGSTTFTPGHKHACAQIRVVFHVRAKDAQAAREIVGANPHDKRIEKTQLFTNPTFCSSSRAVKCEEVATDGPVK